MLYTRIETLQHFLVAVHWLTKVHQPLVLLDKELGAVGEAQLKNITCDFLDKVGGHKSSLAAHQFTQKVPVLKFHTKTQCYSIQKMLQWQNVETEASRQYDQTCLQCSFNIKHFSFAVAFRWVFQHRNQIFKLYLNRQ